MYQVVGDIKQPCLTWLADNLVIHIFNITEVPLSTDCFLSGHYLYGLSGRSLPYPHPIRAAEE